MPSGYKSISISAATMREVIELINDLPDLNSEVKTPDDFLRCAKPSLLSAKAKGWTEQEVMKFIADRVPLPKGLLANKIWFAPEDEPKPDRNGKRNEDTTQAEREKKQDKNIAEQSSGAAKSLQPRASKGNAPAGAPRLNESRSSATSNETSLEVCEMLDENRQEVDLDSNVSEGLFGD